MAEKDYTNASIGERQAYANGLADGMQKMARIDQALAKQLQRSIEINCSIRKKIADLRLSAAGATCFGTGGRTLWAPWVDSQLEAILKSAHQDHEK